MNKHIDHPFDKELSVSMENILLTFRGMSNVSWADFMLNPRRLRGSDFLMRWSQGVWSEERLTQAVNDTGKYFAIPYGPSGTAPNNDVRAFELYFERLEKAGLRNIKRPDLLIYRTKDKTKIDTAINGLNGLSELPFTAEDDAKMQVLLEHAVIAVECENSLWRAKQMPDYTTPFTPQKRLGGKAGLKKTAVIPTIIIKEEDRSPLKNWQNERKIPIHVWHAFFDEAFGISLIDAENLFSQGYIEPTEQVFQAPGGATSKKVIYKIYYRYAYHLATTIEEPKLVADSITDKNGHILPYVRFVGGKSQLCEQALAILDSVELVG
ncbi:MAG TPA: AccI family restriction endonuclease [Candidatus Sumerlaeota bacterium]|nr:MAG: AccI restriction endonuclease [candidate division BRC1 bacterium ADurb.Bin183]HOE63821.1 AccI family restriction endonuclease [Candidatus Sumerlaeota bacterium]HRR32155.1 AccI family restriction endonuclease [Candidatus Sumerlaeia bacterium]HON49728.1 AccI family restriction endonuclease [Candidatus Sumerlaeota bacterium]HOR64024.1 AccI family restriction endonuclease [Candidatus Sumerlaeota bacterium]